MYASLPDPPVCEGLAPRLLCTILRSAWNVGIAYILHAFHSVQRTTVVVRLQYGNVLLIPTVILVLSLRDGTNH